MKTSIIVIAHNEEAHIKACLDSLSKQTVQPDEILVIAHNCRDKTEEIARTYANINVIHLDDPEGIVYARIKGIESAQNEIILCIDGDSYAQKNWVEEMVRVLIQNDNVLVGSWVKFKGTLFGTFANWYNKYRCIKKRNTARWIWGPSMAFWKKDKERVCKILEESITLSKEIGLSRNPDDYWLALFMKEYGAIEVTNKTSVTVHTKETSNQEAAQRSAENVRNGDLMEEFFKNQ